MLTKVILQKALLHVPSGHRLPGTGPVGPEEWLWQDEAYDQQMALRDYLISTRLDKVYARVPGAQSAQAELLSRVVELIKKRDGFAVSGDIVTRPDGVDVDIAGPEPDLVKAGRLVQEDLCVMGDLGAGEYGLIAGLMCFPANWTLSEKIGRPLTGIHGPVEDYDGNIAKRVERLFRAVRHDHPLCRFNFLAYETPQLFTPGLEAAPRNRTRDANFLRSERQTIVRLPDSGAALFAIHTFVVQTDLLDRETYEKAKALIGSEHKFPPLKSQAQSRQ